MCISNIFCRTTQNWIELTGWEMYESYVDDDCILTGPMANSNMPNIKNGEKQDANNTKYVAIKEPELKD